MMKKKGEKEEEEKKEQKQKEQEEQKEEAIITALILRGKSAQFLHHLSAVMQSIVNLPRLLIDTQPTFKFKNC